MQMHDGENYDIRFHRIDETVRKTLCSCDSNILVDQLKLQWIPENRIQRAHYLIEKVITESLELGFQVFDCLILVLLQRLEYIVHRSISCRAS